METRITVYDGKYTLIHENGANLRALRYGEPWRDLTGDGMILALVQEIEMLRACAAGSLKPWDGSLPRGVSLPVGLADVTMVECLFRNGTVHQGVAQAFGWQHTSYAEDYQIIAYRNLPPMEPYDG